MTEVVIIALLLAFSIQVFPVALGFRTGESTLFTLIGAIILVGFQVLMLWLGFMAGNSFTYLVEGYDKAILFIGFLLIGVRLIMEVFKIRRGERTYLMDTIPSGLLASLGQSINTFLLGILFTLIDTDLVLGLCILAISSAIITLIGIFIKPGKTALSLASFLYLLGGLVTLFSGSYFTFI